MTIVFQCHYLNYFEASEMMQDLKLSRWAVLIEISFGQSTVSEWNGFPSWKLSLPPSSYNNDGQSDRLWKRSILEFQLSSCPNKMSLLDIFHYNLVYKRSLPVHTKAYTGFLVSKNHVTKICTERVRYIFEHLPLWHWRKSLVPSSWT
jgi:hypothetical protein